MLTQSIKQEIQDSKSMEELINNYRNKIWQRRFWGTMLRMLIVLLCVAVITFVLSAIVGWLDNWNVSGSLSTTLLVVLIAVLMIVVGFVGIRIILVRYRLNAAITRLDLLILWLKLNREKDNSIDKIERELQIITRIFDNKSV